MVDVSLARRGGPRQEFEAVRARLCGSLSDALAGPAQPEGES